MDLTDINLAALLARPADTLDALDRIECEESLLAFAKRMWPVLEPSRNLIEGWPLEALCEHLEAVTYGQIQKILINVPPGFMKSLMVDVIWPAWEWGVVKRAWLRYVAFSYSASLTERDNRRFRDILLSRDYGRLFGHNFALLKTGEQLVSNDKTGWKLATSVGGVGTGERGDRVILDDPHNVKESESDTVRQETIRWFREGMSNRLNDAEKSAVVIIMQRVHEEDVSGVILSEMRNDYEHLLIPMEWAGNRSISTVAGMREDPRTKLGELAWSDRFSPAVWRNLKVTVGPYAVAGQYQQMPSPRGGGIFKRDWWQVWEDPEGYGIDPNVQARYPKCEYVVASLDGAFGQKLENDYTALTVWGVFRDGVTTIPGASMTRRQQQMAGRPKLILMSAWQKRLPLNGPEPPPREEWESDAQYKHRSKEYWGITEWTADTCRRLRVDRLLIEAKANGHDVANEMRRLHGGESYGIQLIDPGRVDKIGRAYSVQHLLADAMIYAPDRDWADEVITQMSVFPKTAHDDLCLVGETMIATKRGDVPLRDVRVGDMALTPDGWRKVLKSGPTGIKPIVRVAGLEGTGNHPLFTFDRGYIPLDTVMQASPDVARKTLCGFLRTALLKSLNSTASSTDGWEESVDTTYRNPNPTKADAGPRDCMLRFGSFMRERQYRKAMKFTTRTATLSIASLKIWSAYRWASIGACLSALTKKSATRFSNAFGRWPQHGIEAPRGASGTGSMPPSPFTSPAPLLSGFAFAGPSPASGAEQSSKAAVSKRSSVPPPAECRNRGIAAANTNTSTPTMRLVFNLEVEGAHCYYANGILVHNCDSTVQAWKHLRDIGMAAHGHEIERDIAELLAYKPAVPKPLYPA